MKLLPTLKRWWPATHTGYVWLCIALISLTFITRSARWDRHEVFIWDSTGYYGYLVSAFITDDLGDGTYLAAVRNTYRPDANPDYGMVHLPNGKSVFKYPIGLAITHSPWFWLAHGYVLLNGEAADGYSVSYQRIIALGCMAYVLLGLWLLGRELRHYFPDHLAALTLLIIGLGTNLFDYATYDAAMPHGTLFLLNVLLLRYTRQWYLHGTWRAGLALAAVFGLMLLVRPSELLLLGVPVLWGISSWAAVPQRLRYWLAHWPQLAAMVAVVGLVGGVQFLFWRLVGGIWVLDFYAGETFNFIHPHLMEGLFSIRKGWLVYTPVMAIALLGIFWARRYVAEYMLALAVVVPLFIYVTFSWQEWWYGGAFSARPLISLYPLLSFSLASFWARWWLRYAYPLAVVVLLLVVLNLLQTWQYAQGIIDCCDEPWKRYKDDFFRMHW